MASVLDLEFRYRLVRHWFGDKISNHRDKRKSTNAWHQQHHCAIDDDRVSNTALLPKRFSPKTTSILRYIEPEDPAWRKRPDLMLQLKADFEIVQPPKETVRTSRKTQILDLTIEETKCRGRRSKCQRRLAVKASIRNTTQP